MNALVDVSDRYAVVLLTYISQLTTVYFGIKELHEGTVALMLKRPLKQEEVLA